MTQTFVEFMSGIEALGVDFTEKVRTIVLPHARHDNLRLCSTQLIVEVDKNGGFTPHGCPLCLGVEPGQDEQGSPTLKNQLCIDAWTNGLTQQHLPEEVLLNLWFCPQCRCPLMKLVPKFE